MPRTHSPRNGRRIYYVSGQGGSRNRFSLSLAHDKLPTDTVTPIYQQTQPTEMAPMKAVSLHVSIIFRRSCRTDPLLLSRLSNVCEFHKNEPIVFR